MKSYLKFLSRNKLYSAIEFIGLAVSLAFVILIGSYVRQQWKAARGYPEWKKTYAVGLSTTTVEAAPRSGFAELLKAELPEIDKASLYLYLLCQGKVGDVHVNNRHITIVNPDFLDMFPIQWVSGNPDELLESNTVAIAEQYARELFPEGNAVGGIWEDRSGESHHIVAVFRNLGSPIFRCDETAFLQVNSSEAATYVNGWIGAATCLVRSNESEEKLASDIDAVLESHGKISQFSEGNGAMKHGSIERMDRLYFSDLNGGTNGLLKGNKSLLRMLSAVVLLLLLSAIFNYINLSTALAGGRVKEMTMRSVLGATKGQIVWNFLKESLLFTALCTVFAILLAYAFRPVFVHYVDTYHPQSPVSVPFAWHWDFGMVAAVIGLTVFIGLAAGWIPSRVASHFDAIRVIKGDYRTASKHVLSKIFIVFQTGLSVLLVAFSLVIGRQYSHMVHRPLGADIDGLYEQFMIADIGHEDALKSLPFVEEVARIDGYPGAPSYVMTMSAPESDGPVNMAFLDCDSKAFSMFHYEIVEDFHVPNGAGYWLSESAFRRFGINPDDPQMPSWLGDYYQKPMAGVVKDFALTDAAHVRGDLVGIINVDDSMETHHCVLRIHGDHEKAKKELDALYRRLSIEKYGYEIDSTGGHFMKEHLDEMLGEAKDYMRLIELFMFLAVMVALLGLLAMSALYASERTHDIAVRKVFGSTVRGETLKSVGSYMVLVGLSCLIAVPVAVWLAGKYLEDFNYRISGYGWIFVVAVLITFLISFASVLWQDLKAAKTNPAIELKKE